MWAIRAYIGVEFRTVLDSGRLLVSEPVKPT